MYKNNAKIKTPHEPQNRNYDPQHTPRILESSLYLPYPKGQDRFPPVTQPPIATTILAIH
jgi:hypothetical protein